MKHSIKPPKNPEDLIDHLYQENYTYFIEYEKGDDGKVFRQIITIETGNSTIDMYYKKDKRDKFKFERINFIDMDFETSLHASLYAVNKVRGNLFVHYAD